MKLVEVNFDGLVGPTHNYAGLSFGNIASTGNANTVSSPKKAALQGLEKMKLLMDLGIPQGVLPPHPRPNFALLQSLGFDYKKNSLQELYQNMPGIIPAVFSSSSMWAANAATVSPPTNTIDKKTHLTPANLISTLHRFQEADFNYKVLSQIFSNDKYFKIHRPLPKNEAFADEGAANHSFLFDNNKSLELFVYGREAFVNQTQPKKFPARQTLEASQSIARINNVKNNIFMQQHPVAIDSGAFHNDVVCVGHKNVLLYHEEAFLSFAVLKEKINKHFNNFFFISVKKGDLSLELAVKTYLFNSQIVNISDNEMAIIAPTETQKSKHASKVVEDIINADNPISKVYYVNCRESMRNGGGPACLRLRVQMEQEALDNLSGNVILTPKLYKSLTNWVNNNYRDFLEPKDLLDESLIKESQLAIDELKLILNLDL